MCDAVTRHHGGTHQRLSIRNELKRKSRETIPIIRECVQKQIAWRECVAQLRGILPRLQQGSFSDHAIREAARKFFHDPKALWNLKTIQCKTKDHPFYDLCVETVRQMTGVDITKFYDPKATCIPPRPVVLPVVLEMDLEDLPLDAAPMPIGKMHLDGDILSDLLR
jgi:hypothetical protein